MSKILVTLAWKAPNTGLLAPTSSLKSLGNNVLKKVSHEKAGE